MIKDENVDFIKEVRKTFDKYRKVVDDVALLKSYGKVKEVIGSLVISEGPFCKLGDMCRIYMNDDTYLDAEAIGFRNQDVLLATYGPVNGITFGNMVYSFERPLSVMCCDEILGTVLDARGKPLAGGGHNFYETPVAVSHNAVNPMNRPRIKKHIQTGVRAIDGLLTVGQGQRMAIMSGTGVGKSTLLSMIARNTNADVNVIALIGERRREVRDFIERDLGEEGLKRSVLVVATSDDAPLLRVRAAYTATTIAEYFRDKGKNVMFMVDSVTRFALAQREIGLSRGEPPTTRGYTPSVFSELAKLLERTGTSNKGTITAFYNVLVEGDDLDEPITDTVRGILDGHIVLSRDLANRGHFPAIDVNKSISRIMNEVVSNMHKKAAREFLKMSADYNEAKELIMIGGYAKGSMPEVDRAIDYKPMMDRYLQQDVYEVSSFADSKEALLSMFYSQEEIEEDLVNSGDVKRAEDRTNISDNVEYANNDVVIL
ncbi:FliI/YscN family ATPase [Brachyspira murdochii]|uniref:ATPase, FliI/YscN family n=1 Tax=Brachyspira murdochii (strain ATCC 51284 / DSM 12563 / 56-150) TaxID=526224 RepID=D5U5X3_BRAM5|nr:FliI/YscN family ATPase [Brachyspira murdochii]ADG70464.1 ATPase, FliI/YscN family [Brachyspira murdochii DSM 12563]